MPKIFAEVYFTELAWDLQHRHPQKDLSSIKQTWGLLARTRTCPVFPFVDCPFWLLPFNEVNIVVFSPCSFNVLFCSVGFKATWQKHVLIFPEDPKASGGLHGFPSPNLGRRRTKMAEPPINGRSAKLVPCAAEKNRFGFSSLRVVKRSDGY